MRLTEALPAASGPYTARGDRVDYCAEVLDGTGRPVLSVIVDGVEARRLSGPQCQSVAEDLAALVALVLNRAREPAPALGAGAGA